MYGLFYTRRDERPMSAGRKAKVQCPKFGVQSPKSQVKGPTFNISRSRTDDWMVFAIVR